MGNLSTADKLIARFDKRLRSLALPTPRAGRINPSTDQLSMPLAPDEQQHSLGLMRVNHCGEICAQALYRGQALTARDPAVRDALHQAAAEEGDHLAWCESRINQLSGRPSRLNPLFYAGSFALGALAGLSGDRWSLGFVAETERQVERHLGKHLDELPLADTASRAILQVMQDDEARHAADAEAAGGRDLPAPIKSAMTLMSRVMTKTTYKV